MDLYFPGLADSVNCFSAVIVACALLPAVCFARGLNPGSASEQVVIYARYSTGNQRETSIDDQVRTVRLHLDKLGIPHENALVLCDRGISGEREDREGYLKVREMILNGEISILACDEISRLSRGAEAGVVADEMELYGCRFVTADGYDSEHDQNGFMATIKGKMAGMANRELAHRVRRGIAGRALDPKGADGTHPFGYSSRYTDPVAAANYCGRGPKPFKEVFINENEAVVVREIFTKYADGMSMTDIARALNERGVPLGAQSNRRDKNGKIYQNGWHKTRISKLLNQRKYMGIWAWGEYAHRKTRQGKRLIKHADPRDVIISERPELAIVPRDLWDKVQERRKIVKDKIGFKEGQKKRGPQTHHSDAYPSNMLSGLLFCGECGTRMHQAKNQSGVYYQCPNALRNGKAGGVKSCSQRGFVPYDRAVAALTEHLDRELRNCGTWVDDVYQAAVAEYSRLDASLPDELSVTEEKLAAVDKAINNMIVLVENGNAQASILERLKEREAEKRQLESALERLTRRKKRRIELPTVDWVKNQLEKLSDVLAEDSRKSAMFYRKFFGKVLGYIVVAPGKKRGHAEIAFKANRLSAVLDVVGNDLGNIPPSDSEQTTELEGDVVRVALAGNDKLDKLMPTIDAMRQAGKTWRQIEAELKINRGWANRYHRIWKSEAAATVES